ncbi:hypothetical protein [Flavobacterium sp. SM2513]|uniref:hypothetical protein n=1 Tax=Flavobacterium sp. SM2513 TaxID=3424766 RepID=UPI003D7FE0A8
MNSNVRIEEYVPLGDFIIVSFERDQPKIEAKFKKLDGAFLEAFRNKIEFVKDLESSLVLTTEQSRVTAALYAEAAAFNKEVNFLSSYFKGVGLPTAAVTKMKDLLFSDNIEGALLELKAVRQLARANEAALVAEGMEADYLDKMDATYTSMSAKNVMQNTIMNNRKTLVSNNRAHYDELYDYVATVAEKGKIVFKGTRVEDQYTISDLIKRMRAPKRKDDDDEEERED